MRLWTRLAAALLGIVALMSLVCTFEPGLIPAWEEPVVRYRALLVSLPMVAFFIALEVLRLQTTRLGTSAGNTLARRSQPIPTAPTENGFAILESDVNGKDGTVPSKPKVTHGVRTAFTISVLLGVPVATLMARCAVSLFVPWTSDSLFAPWRTGCHSVIGWAASFVAMPLASYMAHALISRDVMRRMSVEAAMLAAILLTPMITFAITYQACWLWIRLAGEFHWRADERCAGLRNALACFVLRCGGASLRRRWRPLIVARETLPR